MITNLTTAQKSATKRPEDITAYVEDFRSTPTGTFVILEQASDVVFPDGETPEYFGNAKIIDTSGQTYEVNPDAFLENYTLFRSNSGTPLYVSKNVGDRDAQTEAFLELAANANGANETLTKIAQLATDEEALKFSTIRQRGQSITARDDLGFGRLAA